MKLFSVLMAVMMMLNLSPQTGAQETRQAAQAEALGGLISQVEAQGLMLETQEMGQVYVKLSDETACEGVERDELSEGQFVFVEYDGKMTRSLPPQVSARKVSMYAIEGVVSGVSEESVTISRKEQGDEVIVRLPEGGQTLYPGCPVTVYTDGIMTASIPGQVNARHIVTPTVEGKVSAVQQDGFSLTDGQGQEYAVNMDKTTVLPETMKEGDRVKVYYDGAATFSLPPQIFAIAVEIQKD